MILGQSNIVAQEFKGGNQALKDQNQPPELFFKKKVFLKISKNSLKNTCAQTRNFIKKETLAQTFFCEFCLIFKNAFSTEHMSCLLEIQ